MRRARSVRWRVSSGARSWARARRRATARSSALPARSTVATAPRSSFSAGRHSLAESSDPVVRAAAELAGLPNVRFLSSLRRGNVQGALDLGLAPGFLPGRVTLDAGRDRFTAAWGAVPPGHGLDAAGVLA